jgi:hypothetical protein
VEAGGEPVAFLASGDRGGDERDSVSPLHAEQTISLPGRSTGRPWVPRTRSISALNGAIAQEVVEVP